MMDFKYRYINIFVICSIDISINERTVKRKSLMFFWENYFNLLFKKNPHILFFPTEKNSYLPTSNARVLGHFVEPWSGRTTTSCKNKCHTLACTEMTKTKKIEIFRAVHVVELSWASIVIIFSFRSLHLGCRVLP